MEGNLQAVFESVPRYEKDLVGTAQPGESSFVRREDYVPALFHLAPRASAR